MFQTANLIEGTFWICLGAGFLVSVVWPGSRRHKLITAVTLAVFGVSDFVEMTTGAWWRPWWLFPWKAACVVVLATEFMLHLRRKAQRRGGEGSGS